MLPAAVVLCVYQIMVYYLLGPVSDVVHALHPQHLILRFVRFCNALCYCHLINQSKEHLPRLIVQFGEITVQLAGSQQFRIHHLSMLPENPKAPLPPKPRLGAVLPAIRSGMGDNSPRATRTTGHSFHCRFAFPLFDPTFHNHDFSGAEAVLPVVPLLPGRPDRRSVYFRTPSAAAHSPGSVLAGLSFLL